MAPSKKTMLFVCLLVAAVAVGVPVAQGQINVGGIISPLVNLVDIQGTLFCSANLGLNVSSSGVVVSPPLTNVTVQLSCGAGNGIVVASVTTNNAGVFSISLNSSSITLTQLLSGCRLLVATPIVGCNATLPSATGILSSPLTVRGTTVNLGPTGFTVFV